MKRLITFIILIAMLSSVCFAAPVQKYEEVIPIAPGITLTKVSEFHSDHNLSYSYIKADLTGENTKLKLLKSDKGVDVLETVPTLAAGTDDVVAAINADFFSIHSGNKGFSLGIEIEDGKLHQSPINPSTMATVAYLDNQVTMSYLDFNITLTAPNGETAPVRHLNKHTSYFGDILMYTKDFNNGMSPAPKGAGVVEVVVENGKIVEFRREADPVAIPENGCVFVVSEWSSMFFGNNFYVGDEIKFDYTITPDISGAEAAFGGGAMLVDNGVVPDSFSHVISGNQPRSAVGIDEKGTTLFLVAVDGRQEMSRGMSMSSLASLMKSLGCYKAVNLDGGGSTNMVASTVWNQNLHTVNSSTENRKVINAIGLTHKSEKGGAVSKIELKSDADAVFVGHPVKITVAAYNSDMRTAAESVSLSSPHGTVTDGVFVPAVSGETVVEAFASEAYAQKTIYAVDTVAGIETDSYIRLKNGESREFNINVFDKMGHYVSVTKPDSFDISSSNENVVSVSGRRLTAKGHGTATVAVKKDGAVSYISVAVDGEGNEKIKFSAPLMNVYSGQTEPSQNILTVGAVNEKPLNLLSMVVNKRVTGDLSNSSQGVIIGKSGGFKSYETSDALCLNVDTSSGGIRKTSSKQWSSIVNAISATQKKNVFVFANSSVLGATEFENKVIKDYFSSLDKNVFVVTPGETNAYKNVNGVSYFTIGNRSEVRLDMSYLNNYKYLVFHFNTSSDVTFEWKNIF